MWTSRRPSNKKLDLVPDVPLPLKAPFSIPSIVAATFGYRPAHITDYMLLCYNLNQLDHSCFISLVHLRFCVRLSRLSIFNWGFFFSFFKDDDTIVHINKLCIIPVRTNRSAYNLCSPIISNLLTNCCEQIFKGEDQHLAKWNSE